jgi:hypothetical protein
VVPAWQGFKGIACSITDKRSGALDHTADDCICTPFLQELPENDLQGVHARMSAQSEQFL